MRQLRAFVLGMREFRSDVTSSTNYVVAYDLGRELAHLLTFRRWDSR